jgi:hypothetical protein
LRLLSRQADVLCSSVAFPAGAVGRDFAPAGESLSFVSPKESNQRKGDPTVCVPPLRYGQPAVLGESGGPQNSLRCAPLRQLRPLSRFPLRSSAQPEGRGSGHRCARPRIPNGPSLRSARVAEDPRPARHLTPHKDAPWRVDPDPLWLRRGAQRFADQGSQLFERSEFCETPRNASTAGCPQLRCGSQTVGSPFFAYFLWRDKESKSPAGARPGLRPLQEADRQQANTPKQGIKEGGKR